MNRAYHLPVAHLVTPGLRPNAVIVFTLLLNACAVSENRRETFADYDTGVSFAGFHSFAWQSTDPVTIVSLECGAVRFRELVSVARCTGTVTNHPVAALKSNSYHRANAQVLLRCY